MHPHAPQVLYPAPPSDVVFDVFVDNAQLVVRVWSVEELAAPSGPYSATTLHSTPTIPASHVLCVSVFPAAQLEACRVRTPGVGHVFLHSNRWWVVVAVHDARGNHEPLTSTLADLKAMAELAQRMQV